jgi:hypothetical protein
MHFGVTNSSLLSRSPLIAGDISDGAKDLAALQFRPHCQQPLVVHDVRPAKPEYLHRAHTCRDGD